MRRITFGLILLSLIFVVAGEAVAKKRLPPPTTVNATDGVFPDRVRVTWSAVAGASYYKVFRCRTESSGCNVLKGVLSVGVLTGTRFDDTRSESDKFHYYRVKACSLAIGCSIRSDPDPGYRGVIVSRVSATMNVADNIFVDGDVNDPNVPEASNDLEAQPQELKAPARVVGFVTALPTGIDGDRFATESDEWDVFQLPLQSGESVKLTVSDWNPDDPLANDIDLYLFKSDNPNIVIDSSENATQTEWVTAPEDGDYHIVVNALSGTSNYLLRSGQSVPLGVSKLSSSANMAEGELIAALRPQSELTSINDQKSFTSRIERFEKDSALTRVKESADGSILYAVDTSRIDRLVPHPLTVKGWGSITPENWQVIRTAKELSVNDDYRWSGPNYILSQMAVPNDPIYALQWHYPRINLPQAWDVTTGSEDVVVAVLDSGVFGHPDLVSNVDVTLGYDFVSNPLWTWDGDGPDDDASDPGLPLPLQRYVSHGTHVAGTVGASGNNGRGVAGVNWDVTIMPVRVLGIDEDTGQNPGTCDDINQGVKWAARLPNDSERLPARTAHIINMSLGGPDSCPGAQELVDQVTSKGIVVIAAAGNVPNSEPNYPASLDNVISVSATTLTDDLATYSSYGSTIDIAAPGGDTSADLNVDNYTDGVLSPIMYIRQGTSLQTTGYGFRDGTSFASPHVAGVAALMKSVYPGMGSNEFFTAISSGEITNDLAEDGATNKDSLFGYGRIDARKAVNWALEQDGKPIDPFLTSSISYANFGSTQLSIDFEIEKGGVGDIAVTGGSVSDTWLQLFDVSTDSDGLGTYRIDVDRTGLIEGTYSGWAAIDSSDGSQISIAITMHVGEKVAGQAGYLYAVILDSLTLENVEQWEGEADSNEYFIDFKEVPPGSFYLIVGTDIDNDFTICDEGELCLTYPGIIVWDQDIDLGQLTMSIPLDDIFSSAGSSASGESASQSGSSKITNIKAMIGKSGLPIRSD